MNKQEYLNYVAEESGNVMVKYTQYVFRLFEMHEERLQRDACDFSTSEIVNVYKGLFSTSLDYLVIVNHTMARYTRYMLSQNLVQDNQNHYEELTKKQLYGCLDTGYLNESICTREELLKTMQELQNPCEKFAVLAMFEGINGQRHLDLSRLSLSNLRDGKAYLQSGKVVPISKELYNLAEESANEWTYYYYNPSDPLHVSKKYNHNDHHIIKNISKQDPTSDIMESHRIINIMHRVRNMTGKVYMKPSHLRESGRIHMIKSLRNGDEDVRDTILRHKGEIEYIYGPFSNQSIPKYLLSYGKYFEI